LKKRSAASTPDKLLEGHVFLVEECLGRGVAESLSGAGFRVVAQGNEIPLGLPDPELFAMAAAKGLVLLSKDLRSRYRPAEKAAIVQCRLAVFQLARGNWTGAEMAGAFIKAKSRILRYLKKQDRPFIVRLNRDGEVTAFLSKADLTRRARSG
jgi:predicted nuclease of predicted toxin-antitoxin system